TNQVKRCMKKFGIKREDVLNRIAGQMPLEKKVKLADFVVDNDGAKSNTRKQVEKIWKEILWR
ncbi:MAG: dephospho-CoA kinase, partial [Candidatus Omnitrophota bacterium]|nr:dephospho-CoA kinase [Candidatus Omnitrophota bacterium]